MKRWSIPVLGLLLVASLAPGVSADSVRGIAQVEYLSDSPLDCGPTRGYIDFEVRDDGSATIVFLPTLIPIPLHEPPGCPDAPDWHELPEYTCQHDADEMRWDCLIIGVISGFRFTVQEYDVGPPYVEYDRYGPIGWTYAWGSVITAIQ